MEPSSLDLIVKIGGQYCDFRCQVSHQDSMLLILVGWNLAEILEERGSGFRMLVSGRVMRYGEGVPLPPGEGSGTGYESPRKKMKFRLIYGVVCDFWA